MTKCHCLADPTNKHTKCTSIEHWKGPLAGRVLFTDCPCMHPGLHMHLLTPYGDQQARSAHGKSCKGCQAAGPQVVHVTQTPMCIMQSCCSIPFAMSAGITSWFLLLLPGLRGQSCRLPRMSCFTLCYQRLVCAHAVATAARHNSPGLLWPHIVRRHH